MEENYLKGNRKTILIGGSAGSLEVLFKLLPELRPHPPFAIIIVLHRRNTADSTLAALLSSKTEIPVHEAEDKDEILAGHIYLAPSDYHLLVERDFSISLDYSEKVNFSRPSLDVTFESAADVYGPDLIGIVLSGANEDGTKGLRAIKSEGGFIIAQKPETAQMPVMPQFAINHNQIDLILDVNEMASFINRQHAEG